jgi:DNA-binding transcriptional regulator YiaG
MGETMQPDFDFLKKILVENLTPIGRLAVLQDLGFVDVADIHPKVLKESYQILQDAITITENSSEFECEFFDSIPESIRQINATYGPILIEKMVKKEGESEEEFKKRKKESDEEQKGKKENFGSKFAGNKKSEQAPLAKALRSKGMSQQDLADRLNVSKTTVSRWKQGGDAPNERGRNPSYKNLEDLAAMFGSVDSIFPALG